MRTNRMKFAAIACAGMLALALVGCGGSGSSGNADNADSSAAEQAADAEQAGAEQAEEAKTEEAQAPVSDYGLTIEGVSLATNYSGEECAVVTFSFTNNSDKTTSFASAVYPKVFQNGVECDSAFMVEGLQNDNYTSDIRPGTTILVDMAYVIADRSDIEVEVTELFSFSNDILVEGTFQLG